MKKSIYHKLSIITVILLGSILIFAALSGCSGTAGTNSDATGSGAAASKLTGTPAEILAQLNSDTNAKLPTDKQMPKTFDDPVTDENCEGVLGLSADQLKEFVSEAFVSVGSINTNAHSVVIAKCASPEAAKKAAEQVAKSYNSQRWICVVPDTSFLMVSGNYLLVASCSADVSTAMQESFTAMAGGSTDLTDVFFTADKSSGIGFAN